MLKFMKISINLIVFYLFFVTRTLCFMPISWRNDSLRLTNETADNVVNLYSSPLQWLKIPRVLRYLPSAVRSRAQSNKAVVQKSIYFYYYKNGVLLLKTSPDMDRQVRYAYIINECGQEKTSFIFHGWTESCATDWVVKLMERLEVHRGGCIACIDYNEWARRPYLDLVRRFNVISQILYEEFVSLINVGLNPKNGYMFAFSYGGQLASNIGSRLSQDNKFKRVDICDIAGPGFDYLMRSAHHEAADNVRCYFSSIDKGSRFRSCHQNIMLGHCGISQPAILSQPYFSSHGLCNQIYINAFDYPFYAVRKAPVWCFSSNPVKNLPPDYTVGYDDSRANISRSLIGDIFVPTGLNYPYNLSKRELILYERYLNGILI